ncbi:MAG TPA: hypothetical protein VMG41_09750 [Gemmatimonadales bacterium]|nr:hypothetical protein [Gemmatimonadales bacterium]
MRAYLRLTCIIFALVAVGHLLRVAVRWPLLIAGRPLPAFASLLVAIVAGALALWAWRLLGEEAKRPGT